jgi:diadenosine tetraphosphate (Ap4A) HIT family hydrolase
VVVCWRLDRLGRSLKHLVLLLDELQALCWKCNTDKGAGDDLDLRSLKGLYSRRESGCIFCEVPRQRVVAENSLAYAVWDAHAVVHGHTLVIPKRHVPDYFDLVPGEDKAVQVLLREMRAAIRRDDVTVEGFNIGVNSGAVAGQTIFHCHVHLFPRRRGDVANPRGGVRHTIPGRGDY